MKNGKAALFLGGLMPLLVSAPAVAEIISGAVTGGTALTAGGTFVKLTPPLPNLFGPPDSVGNDDFQSPNLYGFDEDQNILIGTLEPCLGWMPEPLPP